MKNVLKFILQVSLTIVLTTIATILLLTGIVKNFCQDWSLCFSIIIFLIGIHVTIKIRVLDSEEEYRPLFKKLYFGKEILKKNELAAFFISIVLNLVFLASIFICISSSNVPTDSITTSLNTLICINLAILIRNLNVICRLYYPSIFKKNTEEKELIDAKNTNFDLFEVWLNKKEDSKWVARALTDSSYKNVNHELKDIEINAELATFGDAIIKMCLSELLLDNVKNITEDKKNYESDKFFVEIIAKHYDILKFIDYDINDEKKPKDYIYGDSRKKNNNPHKYIATAVEAMIGAIFKETNDLKPIIELLDSWRQF